jgi:hypothetical protein
MFVIRGRATASPDIEDGITRALVARFVSCGRVLSMPPLVTPMSRATGRILFV